MKKYQQISGLLLRLSMPATFLSAVASRLGLWGKASSGWRDFLSYTASLLSFLPSPVIPFFAIASTILETILSISLIIGLKTRQAAVAAACLLSGFILVMTFAEGIKSPLDYSVLVDCAACLLLSTLPHFHWSLDAWISQKTTRSKKQ